MYKAFGLLVTFPTMLWLWLHRAMSDCGSATDFLTSNRILSFVVAAALSALILHDVIAILFNRLPFKVKLPEVKLLYNYEGENAPPRLLSLEGRVATYLLVVFAVLLIATGIYSPASLCT